MRKAGRLSLAGAERLGQLGPIVYRVRLFARDADLPTLPGRRLGLIPEGSHQTVVQDCEQPEVDVAVRRVGMVEAMHLGIGEDVLEPARAVIGVAVLAQQRNDHQERQGDGYLEGDAQ